MANRHIEGPNTYPELRSRVAAHVGSRVMDIGERLKEATIRTMRRKEAAKRRKSTHQRGQGKQPWKAPPSGGHDKREADNGRDSVQKEEEA